MDEATLSKSILIGRDINISLDLLHIYIDKDSFGDGVNFKMVDLLSRLLEDKKPLNIPSLINEAFETAI